MKCQLEKMQPWEGALSADPCLMQAALVEPFATLEGRVGSS